MSGVGQSHLPIKRPTDFLVEVAKGNIPGHSVRHRFGKALVGTTLVPIASSLKYPTPIAATALEVVSDDANDTAGGSGAREITILGLNENWEEITQAVPTSGLTPVGFPINMLRVYDWWVSASGTYATSAVGSHAGTITIQEDSGGALWFNGTTTPYPKGQSEISGFTVPLGYRALLYIQAIVADSAKSVDVIFVKRSGADIVAAPFSPMRTVKEFTGVGANAVGIDSNSPIDSWLAKTDLIFMGIVSNATASVSVDYEVLLIEDGY